jgi:hypothetical protein
MVSFTAVLKRFGSNGEKTGWTYIDIPFECAEQLMPGNRKGFRVKGKIDQHSIQSIALLPIGGGQLILTVNATMRKAIRKQKGDTVTVKLAVDHSEIKPPSELMECLADEPEALDYFNSLTKSHRGYFIKWIDSARTEPTKAKRIVDTINALSKKLDYGAMLRSLKKDRQDLLKEL